MNYYPSVDDDDNAVIVQPIKPSTTSNKSATSEHENAPRELRLGSMGSLEVLAIAVSLFFVATVLVSGDALFAPTTMTTTSVPKINADEVLQTDFLRNENSVSFDD